MSASAPLPAEHLALPAGLRLGEFEIRSVLGGGGFGIVYRAWDHVLEREVAIKEYMPTSLATRSATHHVTMVAGAQTETFAVGLRSFVNEAKLLARFEHPSLVKVLRFWEQHGTAYMAMPFYRGKTLKALRKDSATVPEEAWLRRLCESILGALEAMHREGVYHRDISPDNIVFDDDNRPVLLDFGAARRDLSGSGQGLTAILKPSYAPLEQYGEAGGLRQGPWTDLYALGATLHFMVTGHPPPPATARALSDERPALAHQKHGTLSRDFLALVDWLLATRPEHRPQDVTQVRGALAGRVEIPLPPPPAAEPSDADRSEWPATEFLQRDPKTLPPARGAAPLPSTAAAADDEDDPDATVVRPANWRPSQWPSATPRADQVTEPALPQGTSLLAMMASPPPPPPAPPPPHRLPSPPPPAPAAASRASPEPAPRAAAKPAKRKPETVTVAEQAEPRARLPWLLGLGGVALAGIAVVMMLGRGEAPSTVAAPTLAASAAPAASTAASALAAAEPAPPSSAVTVIGAAPTAPPSASGAEPAQAATAAAARASAPVTALPAAPALVPPRAAPADPALAAAKPARAAPSRPSATRLPSGMGTGPSSEPASTTAAAAEAAPPQPSPRASAVQPAAATERRDPNEACAGRVLVALHRCILRECARADLAGHPACVRARAIEQRNQDATNQY